MGKESDPVNLDICAGWEGAECNEGEDEEDYPCDGIQAQNSHDTMIVHEFVNFSLVAKFHSEHPSSHPQTSPDHVLSSFLRNSIFFVFIGEV